MHLLVSSGKWRPFCLGLNVLKKKKFQIEVIHRSTPMDRLCNVIINPDINSSPKQTFSRVIYQSLKHVFVCYGVPR